MEKEEKKEEKKNKVTGIISFFVPGLGQLIHGNFLEGIIFLATAIAIIGLALFSTPLILIIYLLLVFKINKIF